MESQHGVRFRVNISTSTKGYHTWDATVEMTDGFSMISEEAVELTPHAVQKVLEQSDALVAALEERYPNGERAVREKSDSPHPEEPGA